jgi:hypothetical protein
MVDFKRQMPWWMKVAVKIPLSRLPVRHQLWSRIGIFKHGHMNIPAYAYSVFTEHLSRASVKPGFSLLELGPGDTLCSVLIGRAFGANKIFLVDTKCNACCDMESYRAMYDFLIAQGHTCCADLRSYDGMMKSCNACYLTCGLSSLKEIPRNSIDFVFSQAVLEHIRKKDFVPTLKELHRIMKSDARSSHAVDLKDHLGGSLNNLRFSETLWESDFFAKSGFYTNRIRFLEMLRLFEEAGFTYQIVNKNIWDKIPVDTGKLQIEFRRLPIKDLIVTEFTVLLTPF